MLLLLYSPLTKNATVKGIFVLIKRFFTWKYLQKADKYKNKVPDYKISSGGGNIHVGVVLDDPAYSNYDLNKPPEAFTSIGADVSLKKVK